VFRYKDLRNWWASAHFDRIEGVRSAAATAWEPESKPFWFTEYGCAAIEKGSNEPNKFLDPKSSESRLPKYSTGRRDDLIQMQYLRAMGEYWGDAAHNPTSSLYGETMVDMTKAHVWAWDSRPFPSFPANRDLWNDGANYGRGHWLNGRATNQPLASVVAEICAASGLPEANVTALYGVVRGFVVNDVRTARSALQPLMTAFGFEAVEREGSLQFGMRDGRVDSVLDAGRIVLSDEIEGGLEFSRAPDPEVAGQLRLAFTETEGDYAIRVAEAIFPDEALASVTQTELPLVLTAAEGRAIVDRWLIESRIARDSARFSLPRSAMRIGAGDVVVLHGRRYRIDRIEQGDAQTVEAVCVEPGVYVQSDAAEEPISQRAFVAPVPVFPQFLDLPLLSGTEVPHAPHLAVTALPWPGTVAVWAAPIGDEGYELNHTVTAPSVIGVTETLLLPAKAGLWDRGPALRVRLFGGQLASASAAAVLNGANVLAIGDGSSDRWEILQFASAALVGPSTYDITERLRGQAGTDGVVASPWPPGSRVVLLNRSVQQIGLASSARGLARRYRIGPAARGFADPSVVVQTEAFSGIGLRPYSVCHLEEIDSPVGDTSLRWVRRTRIDGDTWESTEVPLGEDREQYQVRVIAADAIRREATVFVPEWTYSAAMKAADGVVDAFTVAVAQVSQSFGPGPFRTVMVTE